jgi:arylsulfatase A-like enzyme
MRALALLIWLAAALHAQATTPPNVLVIVLDDVGVDSLGAYAEGMDLPPSPNIDALAQGGVLFRNTWSPPLCSPARAAILTGRRGYRTGIGWVVDVVPEQLALPYSEITIPEMLDLGASGFSHAAIGKWHLNRTGDYLLGPASIAPNVAGFSHYDGPIGNLWPPWDSYFDFGKYVNGTLTRSTTYATTDQVDSALAWMQTAPEPWFCYLAFSAAHKPLHVPPASLHTQSLAGLDLTITPRPFYKAVVEAIDTELGRLFSGMGALEPRTNILLLGDDGTESGYSVPPFDPVNGKGTLYEGGINVPFIMKGPAVTLPGTESGALVNVSDVFATVAELAGVDLATAMPGSVELDSRSVVPLVQGTLPADQHRTLDFVESFQPNGWGPTDAIQAARDLRFKVIRNAWVGFPQGDEFYDLVADPFETLDLLTTALSPAQQTAYDALSAALDALPPPCLAFGAGTPSAGGALPELSLSACPTLGSPFSIHVKQGASGAPGCLVASLGQLTAPFMNGTSYLDATQLGEVPHRLSPAGDYTLGVLVTDPTLVGVPVFLQAFYLDAGAPGRLSMTGGYRLTLL